MSAFLLEYYAILFYALVFVISSIVVGIFVHTLFRLVLHLQKSLIKLANNAVSVNGRSCLFINSNGPIKSEDETTLRAAVVAAPEESKRGEF